MLKQSIYLFVHLAIKCNIQKVLQRLNYLSCICIVIIYRTPLKCETYLDHTRIQALISFWSVTESSSVCRLPPRDPRPHMQMAKNIVSFRAISCIASPSRNNCQTSVYKAKHGRTGEIIAVKMIMLAGEGAKAEIESLTKKLTPILVLHHANVVRHDHLQEMLDQRQLAECGLPKQLECPQYQIIMEYCSGGTLHEYAKKSPISALLLQHWTRQLVEGLSYLYEKACVHRDIKGENILLSSDDINTCNLKIGDLGDLKRLLQNYTHPREVSHDKGTYAFMSPEMISGEENPATRVGRRTDVWSLGCVLIQMITGQLPRFVKVTEKGTEIQIKEEMAVMYFVGKGGSPIIPEGLPRPVEDFIRVCLTRNADQRPYAPHLKTHPFLTATDAGQWTLPERPPRR